MKKGLPCGDRTAPEDLSGRANALPSLQSRAWWITAAYTAFAALWIYFSDNALSALIRDPHQLVAWSVYKGIAFVLVTAVLLLLLMRWSFGTIERGYRSLKAHEREIERLSSLYAALSQINQAIVWSKDRHELLQKVCHALGKHGGFPMSWIGWEEPETKRLMPVARWGDDQDYLKTIRVYTDERAEGQGPSGTAFRENRAYICNDLLNDPATLPWRNEARRRDFRASAVFPIRIKNLPCATLSVYAYEPDFFQEKEIELLTEAAADISYALENFSQREEHLLAETAAHHEKLFSDTMIESMPGILYFYNDQGKFLRWNRNFENVSGYTGEEIARMHPLDFFQSEDKRPLAERIRDVFEKGDSSIEAPFLSKGGTTTPYFFTGRKVVLDGQTCLVGVGIDISERKQAESNLEKSERRYRTTLDNILEGCQLIGHDWTYLYLNHAASIQNRRPNDELLGKKMPEMWPGIEASPVFTLLQRCMKERIGLHEEAEFTFLDGTTGWFDVRVQAVPEGIFVLSIDISERHNAEMALRELNENLELKVNERTAEMQNALVRAEAADRIKSAFLATMSHELRTPLNSIIGFTGIVLQELPGPLNAEQTKQLNMVRSSARHLLELINDVLDISKIEAGQLEVQQEPFDLPASITRAVNLVSPLANKKELHLECTVSPELGLIKGDQRRVEQILINLLNNAIKFTDHGNVTLSAKKIIDFRLKPGAPPCDAALIRISDTGIGIKPEDLASLFQPFRQVDSGISRQHDGTGLGLAICLKLVTLMQGNISATSEWTKGSEFIITLPLNPLTSGKPGI